MKTAIVSGGTRGIGAAISRSLSEAGLEVVALYRADVRGAEAFCEATGIATRSCDVADYNQCSALVKTLLAEGRTVQVVVNNAGIVRDSMFHKMTPDQWRAVIDTNLSGVFNLTHCVWGHMRERQFGRVINIASINGQTGQVGQANYSASKSGVIGFTRTLALEGARKNITVNCIAPGYVETSMTSGMPDRVLDAVRSNIPAGRLGQPGEIGRVAAFLASPDSGFINGATFAVNGAQHTA